MLLLYTCGLSLSIGWTKFEVHLSRDLTHVAWKFGGSAKPAVDLIHVAVISTIDQAMATYSATVATPSATANWTANLDARGLYYKGLVEDIDTLLEMHKLYVL